MAIPAKEYECGRYEIKRDGQQDPDFGDLVEVTVRIYLPCRDSNYLSSEIVFRRRLQVAGEHLNPDWGLFDPKQVSFRYREFTFNGKTWRDAELKADEWAVCELDKLSDAIGKRREALRRADA